MGKIREFNDEDWTGFGGAEPFHDGSQPLIVELWNDYTVAIADDGGIQVHIFDSENPAGENWFMPAPALWSQGIGWAMLTRLSEAISASQLAGVGFEQI